MKVLEFHATLNPGDTLTVPNEVAAQVPRDEPLRVLVLIPDGDDERDWERLTAEEFAKGYADSDAIYDQLSAG
jgi:hypothetical protein